MVSFDRLLRHHISASHPNSPARLWDPDFRLSKKNFSVNSGFGSVYVSVPDWKAEPYPVTRNVGDLQIILTNVITGYSNDISIVRPGPPLTQARFRITQSGKPTEWRAGGVKSLMPPQRY